LSVIDLENGRVSLEESADFTVGIEEEFALLDPVSLDLVPRYEQLRNAAQDDELLGASVAGELIASEIEIRSGRGEDLHAAIAAQREMRRRLFALAGAHGVRLGATATHPWADYRQQQIIDTEHYHRVEDGLQYVARRNNTFSVHVHVGIRGADRAIKVCDRLRHVLPELLAISANSPFLEGSDSGLHSVRTQIFTKSFPRCGIPDPFGDWPAFAKYVDFLVATRSIVEYTQVWWSVRPHLSFGTIEVRICDVQSTASESEGLISLIVACVAQAAREVDEGRTPAELPARLLEENVWRAIRYGLGGELLDLHRAEPYPAHTAVERLLAWTEEMRGELGIDVQLSDANGAQRQRALLTDGMTLAEVYAATVDATQATYSHGTISGAEVK
jgi:glutamate---cysteine ligase / carboxylate-amine ligase